MSKLAVVAIGGNAGVGGSGNSFEWGNSRFFMIV